MNTNIKLKGIRFNKRTCTINTYNAVNVQRDQRTEDCPPWLSQEESILPWIHTPKDWQNQKRRMKITMDQIDSSTETRSRTHKHSDPRYKHSTNLCCAILIYDWLHQSRKTTNGSSEFFSKNIYFFLKNQKHNPKQGRSVTVVFKTRQPHLEIVIKARQLVQTTTTQVFHYDNITISPDKIVYTKQPIAGWQTNQIKPPYF